MNIYNIYYTISYCSCNVAVYKYAYIVYIVVFVRLCINT